MDLLSNIGSALGVGIACIGVALGQGYLTMKAMKTIGRNPKMHTLYLTIAILGIALVESAAIYGLIMGFQILTSQDIHALTALGIGLAVGLTGLGVGIGEGKMIEGAFNALNKNPESKNKIMTYMILFLALIESAAIYGLVVGYQLLSGADISPVSALASGLTIGLAGIGVAIGEGMLAKKCLETIGDDEVNTGFYVTLGVLGIALVESVVIYGLIIAFNIISINSDDIGIIAAGISIGLCAIGVGIGEGILVSGCFDAIKNNPKNKARILTYMILFIALIESAAIYGLIIAFGILSNPESINLAYLGAAFAIGFAGLGVGVGEGIVARNAIVNISSDSKNSHFYLTLSILGIALVESAAIYGLIVATQVLSLGSQESLYFIGAGLAIGLAGLGVGIGEGKMVSGAINAVKNNPKIKTKILTYMILFLALIESAAIYGLIVSFQIISSDQIHVFTAIAIGISIGLAGMGVGIGEGQLCYKSLDSISRNAGEHKLFLVSTILFIALVESVAIYALVLSFEMLQSAGTIVSIGIAAAIGLAGLGVGVSQGILTSKSIEMMGENTANKNILLTITILGIALVESVAIYSLIVGFQILGNSFQNEFIALAMGVSIGLCALGVSYGQGLLVSGAISAIAHHPENKNKILSFMVLFLALIESAAIYGLVISFQLLSSDGLSYGVVGVALSIGLAGLGVGVGQGMLAYKSIQYIGNDYKNASFYLISSVLTIALVESAAIYGLIVAFELVSTQSISQLSMIASGLAIGLTGLGVGIGEGYMVRGALDSMRLNPKYRSKILMYTILFIALVESVAIYGLVVSSQILSQGDLGGFLALGASLAIGIGGIGVALGEGMLLNKSLDVIGKNPKFQSLFLTTSILSVALVESAAIYSLVIAFEILGVSHQNTLIVLGAGLSVGLAALGAGVGEGMLSRGVLYSMYRNPREKSRDLAFMVLFIALIEVLAIYGLIISFQILS